MPVCLKGDFFSGFRGAWSELTAWSGAKVFLWNLTSQTFLFISVAYCYMMHTGTKQTLNCFPMWGFKKKFSLLLWQNVWGECAVEEEEEEPKKCCQLIQRGSQAGSASYLWKQAGPSFSLDAQPSTLSRRSSGVTSPAWEQVSIGKPTALLRSWVARNPLRRTRGKGGKSDDSKITGQVGLVGGQPTIQWIKFMCPVGWKRWRVEPLWSLGCLWIGCSLQNVFLSKQKALL